jgi:hypothetical protein
MATLGQTKSTVFDPGTTSVNPVELARRQLIMQQIALQQNQQRLDMMRQSMAPREAAPVAQPQAEAPVRETPGDIGSYASYRRNVAEARAVRDRNKPKEVDFQTAMGELAKLDEMRDAYVSQRGAMPPEMQAVFEAQRSKLLGSLPSAAPSSGGRFRMPAAELTPGGNTDPFGVLGNMKPAGSGSAAPQLMPDGLPPEDAPAASPSAPLPDSLVAAIHGTAATAAPSADPAVSELRSLRDQFESTTDPAMRQFLAKRMQEIETTVGVGGQVDDLIAGIEGRAAQRQADVVGRDYRASAIRSNPNLAELLKERITRGMTEKAAIDDVVASIDPKALIQKGVADVAYFADLDDSLTGNPTADHLKIIEAQAKSHYEQIELAQGKDAASSYIDALIATLEKEFGDVSKDMNADMSRILLNNLRALKRLPPMAKVRTNSQAYQQEAGALGNAIARRLLPAIAGR